MHVNISILRAVIIFDDLVCVLIFHYTIMFYINYQNVQLTPLERDNSQI